MSEELPPANNPKPSPPAPLEPNIARMLHVPESGEKPEKPPKKKRRWLRVLGVLVLLLLLIVISAPYIASTGPIRAIIVSKINKNLNGSVAIDNYSVGWTGGIKANGIRVFDSDKKVVLSVPRI